MAQVSKQSKKSLAVPAAELLQALSADFLTTLEAVQVPAYVIDVDRRVRWQNEASIDLVGDLRGRLDDNLLSPDDLERARAAFEHKRDGASQTQLEVSFPRRDGKRVRAAISSVPLKNGDGTMIGSFGLVQVLEELDGTMERPPRLSRRERETLSLLAAGYSTEQMAEEMSISKETVRNHVKRVLRNLDARSRVQAVAKARSAGLI
jgi:DNA-binding CsgD family transcriptional regulator